MARHRKKPITDPVVLGCIDRLKKGNVNAVGVLADYLEENGLPHAAVIRRLWADYSNMEAHFLRPDTRIRRQLSRWEEIALWRMWLFRKVRTVYQIPVSSMKLPDLKRFYTRPIVADPTE